MFRGFKVSANIIDELMRLDAAVGAAVISGSLLKGDQNLAFTAEAIFGLIAVGLFTTSYKLKKKFFNQQSIGIQRLSKKRNQNNLSKHTTNQSSNNFDKDQGAKDD